MALDTTTTQVPSCPSPDGQYIANPSGFPITLIPTARQIYVGTSGDLVVTTLGGTSITFKNVMSGTVLAGWVITAIATGTTAKDLVIGY